MIKKKLQWLFKNPLWTILFILFAIFLFTNFSNSYLWSDEGATATIGSNTLLFGIPKVYDGENWIKPPFMPQIGWVNGNESYTSDLISTEHAWGQYYLIALSFSLFGFTTFAARLPFVLISFLSLFFIFHLLALLYPNKKPGKNRVTFLAMILLFTSTFFFLISRQARMYPLVLLFTTVLLINYIQIIRDNKRRRVPWFSLSAILLFYSHFYVFFATMFTVGIHFIFFTRWKQIKSMVLSGALITIFTLPWFLRFVSPNNYHFANIFDPLFAFTSFNFLVREVNFYVPILFLLLSHSGFRS